MVGICSGISLYKGKTGRFPESLKEMVKKGYLPTKSKIYFCPLKHGIKSNKEISYSECEYNIIFEPNKIVVSIPQEVFGDNRYGYIDEKHRKREMLIVRGQH
jgi:hypothetical protein